MWDYRGVVIGESFKDIFGGKYASYITYINTGSNSSAWNDYRINGQYSRLKGTIAMNYDYRATTFVGNFRVYGDNKLLYSSPSIKAGFDTMDFEVDLTGVLTLRIEFFVEKQGTNSIYGSQRTFAIVDVGLYQ